MLTHCTCWSTTRLQPSRSPLAPGSGRFCPAGVADGGEGVDGLVDVVGGMGGGYLHSDAGLALGHHGVAETDYVDPFIQQHGGHLRSHRGVAAQQRLEGSAIGVEA